MAKKNDRPVINNPLAGMGLDEIVRGITSADAAKQDMSEIVADNEIEEETELNEGKNTISIEEPQAKPHRKRRTASEKRLDTNLDKYTNIGEQGVAIWLPKEVKKRLEIIRANANRNIPVRALAAAIIMTYIEENESTFVEL